MERYNYKNGVSYKLKYEIVFCTRYKRKVFNYKNVRDYFLKILNEYLIELGATVNFIKCNDCYIYLGIDLPPTLSISSVIKNLKMKTGKPIITNFQQFSKMPNLWTRNYIVSSEQIQPEDILYFISKQRSRY